MDGLNRGRIESGRDIQIAIVVIGGSAVPKRDSTGVSIWIEVKFTREMLLKNAL
jgi:hypothetical protein